MTNKMTLLQGLVLHVGVTVVNAEFHSIVPEYIFIDRIRRAGPVVQ